MKAGDKVVCVDDGPSMAVAYVNDNIATPGGWLKKGQVYFVECFFINRNVGGIWFPGPAVTILGKPVIFSGVDLGFSACRFRPVAEVGHPPIEVERPQELEVRPC